MDDGCKRDMGPRLSLNVNGGFGKGTYSLTVSDSQFHGDLE